MKSKTCSAYPPTEPSSEKSKIRQCVIEWSDISLLLWRKGTEYCSNHRKW